MANIGEVIFNYLSSNLAYPITQTEAKENSPTPYIVFDQQLDTLAHHSAAGQGCKTFNNFAYTVTIEVTKKDTDMDDGQVIVNTIRDLMNGQAYPATGPGIVSSTLKSGISWRNTANNTKTNYTSFGVIIDELIAIP